MELPVIKVKWDNPQGFAYINKEDYDPTIHELYDAIPVIPESESDQSVETEEPSQVESKRRKLKPLDE